MKYKNQEEIGSFLGDWCGAHLQNDAGLGKIDVVVPVPLHPKKQKKRGYNQVALFAQKIAESLHAEYRDDILVKGVNIKSQTKKDRHLRWESSKEAFCVNPDCNLNFRHVLLVDDVITTGSTMESCTRALLQLEEVDVSLLSMAVVQQG
ncbi:comF family protein [Flagellimonas taeanensis]|uniref:ComF family protein n=1 Tax=Flagellimonas taeanensis TaxID=1005926 RepID=A0A1I1CYU3_9FLAO|nr:phosphoribosyltransferase family protein [Allomuricauda taeanensis]SFB67697.1 comF family protein [Allomuricauda taeanensis]